MGSFQTMTTHGRSGTTSTSLRRLVELDRGGGRRGHRLHCRPRRRVVGVRACAARPARGRGWSAVSGQPYDRAAMAVGSRPLVPSSLAPGGVLPRGTQPRDRRTRVGGFVALTKPRIIELLLITTLPDHGAGRRTGCPGSGSMLDHAGRRRARRRRRQRHQHGDRPRHRPADAPHPGPPAGHRPGHARGGR